VSAPRGPWNDDGRDPQGAGCGCLLALLVAGVLWVLLLGIAIALVNVALRLTS